MHFQWGRKTPKIVPSPWDCVTPQEEYRATAIGTKIGKDRACGSEICSRTVRQTDTHAQTQRRAPYNTSPPLLWAK